MVAVFVIDILLLWSKEGLEVIGYRHIAPSGAKNMVIVFVIDILFLWSKLGFF